MSNLIPEKRLNRLGRLVTKWVRGDSRDAAVSSQLKEVAPTLPSSSATTVLEDAQDAKERDALGNELFGLLRRDMQRRLAQSYPKIETDNRVLSQVFDKVMNFETSTLRILREYYHGSDSNLLTHMENVIGSEIELRERLHYAGVVEYGLPNKTYLDKARAALGADDLSLFSKGSDEYAMTETMLGIIIRDEKSLEGKRYESMHASARQASLLKLGRTMRGYPDRSESIAAYISDRGLLIREIEHWHLREYLATPAPSLSEGFL